MCYYCENGLPPRVAAIINPLLERFPGAEFGPGHVVFSDFNLEGETIQWCLDNFGQFSSGHPAAELEATRTALLALLEIPEDERNPMPAETEMN